MTLNGADYITFDGIDITAGGETRKCVRITATAQHNRFRNATFTGNGTTSSVSYTVYMLGANNDDNRFSNLTVSNAREGFRLTSYSGAGQQSAGFIIENCTVSGVWLGVYANYLDGLHVRDCDLQLNGSGNSGSAWGIHIDTQVSGDTTYFYRNKVHNIVTSGGSSGSGLARIDPDAGAARVYNNFYYDFQVTGTGQIRAIYTEVGNIGVYFNSVRINDVASTGAVYACYVGASGG